MGYESAVGILQGLAYLNEEFEALVQAEPMLTAVFRDGKPRNVFHGKKRSVPAVQTAIVQPCNIGVLQSGENLPLFPEQSKARLVECTGTNEFERYGLIELTIGAFGPEHRTHGSGAQVLHQPVSSDLLSA